jgi:DNA-binding LacI/PurR family transcriptional regulator
VSRVINGGHWVSPEARAAVEDAIRKTGYRANEHARSLVTGRSNSVAFLLTEPQHLLFEDPNFPRLLRGATEAAALREMPMVLLVAGTAEERRRVAGYVEAGHVDGVLLISSHEGNPMICGSACRPSRAASRSATRTRWRTSRPTTSPAAAP